ncbi:MAG: hypothetical protein ACFFAN_15810 [Promethearchaeota archaeon]
MDHDAHGLEQQGECIVQFIRTVKDWNLLKKWVKDLETVSYKDYDRKKKLVFNRGGGLLHPIYDGTVKKIIDYMDYFQKRVVQLFNQVLIIVKNNLTRNIYFFYELFTKARLLNDSKKKKQIY